MHDIKNRVLVYQREYDTWQRTKHDIRYMEISRRSRNKGEIREMTKYTVKIDRAERIFKKEKADLLRLYNFDIEAYNSMLKKDPECSVEKFILECSKLEQHAKEEMVEKIDDEDF